MALSKTVHLKDQFDEDRTFENAYHRVSRIEGGKDEMVCYVQILKNADATRALTESTYAFSPSLDGENFITQAYEHLKTLSEFAGAVDC